MNCYEQSEYLFSKQFQERFGDLMLTISQLKRVEDRIMRRGHNMNETDWQQISSKADDLDQQMTVYLDLLNEMSRPFLSFRY